MQIYWFPILLHVFKMCHNTSENRKEEQRKTLWGIKRPWKIWQRLSVLTAQPSPSCQPTPFYFKDLGRCLGIILRSMLATITKIATFTDRYLNLVSRKCMWEIIVPEYLFYRVPSYQELCNRIFQNSNIYYTKIGCNKNNLFRISGQQLHKERHTLTVRHRCGKLVPDQFLTLRLSVTADLRCIMFSSKCASVQKMHDYSSLWSVNSWVI